AFGSSGRTTSRGRASSPRTTPRARRRGRTGSPSRRPEHLQLAEVEILGLKWREPDDVDHERLQSVDAPAVLGPRHQLVALGQEDAGVGLLDLGWQLQLD